MDNKNFILLTATVLVITTVTIISSTTLLASLLKLSLGGTEGSFFLWLLSTTITLGSGIIQVWAVVNSIYMGAKLLEMYQE
jgi:hypothetical protein